MHVLKESILLTLSVKCAAEKPSLEGHVAQTLPPTTLSQQESGHKGRVERKQCAGIGPLFLGLISKY